MTTRSDHSTFHPDKRMKATATQLGLVERLAELSDPVRLRMLRCLETEELAVGEVAAVVQLPQSTVSRHLKMLADGGWVARRAEGTATLYRLVRDDLPPALRALWHTVREQMGADAVLAEDARRLKGVLEERKTDSQTFFGRVGGEWDDVRAQLFGSRFSTLALLSLLRRDWVVADLGCGTGNAAELLAPVVERVIAVDTSDAMLEAARRRLSEHRNVEFVRASIEKMPLKSESIDVAACFLVLHHHAAPAEVIREAARTLRSTRSGGILLVVDMVRHERAEYRRTMGHLHLGFDEATMVGWMREAGLSECVYRTLPPETGARGPGLFVATGKVEGARGKA